MFDKICPRLKTRALMEERILGMSIFDKYSERYVIPMHRENVWTNKWMQDARNNFLQVSYHDSSAQYMRGWGSFNKNRGLTLCYSCKRSGHLAKECPGRRPSFLCCKAMDHELLDCTRMIVKVERMNKKQEDHKKGQETEIMEEPHEIMIEPQKESEKVLLQMKETLNDHRHIILSEIFKEKECIETIIGDFNIDCVLDEETQVNIMTERTWKLLGDLAMIHSLGGIGLLRGKLIALCGRINQISMSAHGTSIEE
jgi:hypothetical protein